MAWLYRIDTCRVCEINEELEGSFEDLQLIVKNEEEDVFLEILTNGMGRNDFEEMFSIIDKPGLYVFAADDGTVLVTDEKINSDDEMALFLDKIWDEEYGK